jgi:hypothetical protein
MSIKVKKDKTKLLAKTRLKAGEKNYFDVFIWKDHDSFNFNTLTTTNLQNTIGSTNLSPTIIEVTKNTERTIIRPKLGEIHFIKDNWNLNVVAHELCHALIHRIRQIPPKASKIINQSGNAEELICYEFGKWVEDIYRFMWKVNPPQRIKK